MRLSGEFVVAAPPEDAWQVFMDPRRLCSVMPGCERLEQQDPTHYTAVMATNVQFMTIRARVFGTLLEAEPYRHLIIEMIGETIAMAGAFRNRMTLDLTAADEATHIAYEIDATLLGRLGTLGEPIVRSTAKRLAQQFADNVTNALGLHDTTCPPATL